MRVRLVAVCRAPFAEQLLALCQADLIAPLSRSRSLRGFFTPTLRSPSFIRDDCAATGAAAMLTT